MAKKPKYPEKTWFKRPTSAAQPVPVDPKTAHKTVTINGTNKRISKLSEYHLDMITLDADDKNKK